MASVLTDPMVINKFYSKFWNSEEWGRAEPNNDERLRANAITNLIEKFVLTSEGTVGDLRILDLGCGRGWLTSRLSRYGTVLGIDPVPAAIERANILFPELNFRVSDGGELISEGFENQFDLIVSSEVIEHIVDDQKPEFLSNLYQLLKSGGFAILTTPRAELQKRWNNGWDQVQPIEEWISEAQLQHLCESAEFRVVAKDRVFLPDFPYDWLSRTASGRTSRRLESRFGEVSILRRLRYHCGIYQVLLLGRDS